MKFKKILIDVALSLLPIILLFAVWTIASNKIDSDFILPNVDTTIKSMWALFCDGVFYRALLSTIWRSLIAFLFSFVIAFILAFLSSKYIYAKRVISPIISIMRALPTIAIALLLVFWTTNKIAPIIVTSLVVLPTLYTQLFSAFNGIDKDVVEMCYVFKLPKFVTLKKVIVPSVLPQVLLAVGSGISLNLKLMVAAEVLSSTPNSLGYLLNDYKHYFALAFMLAIVCTILLIGTIIELAFNFLSKRAGRNL